MLIDWWERIRGFSEWSETRAVILSLRTWTPPRLRVRRVPPRGSLLKLLTVEYATIDGHIHQKTICILDYCPTISVLEPGDDFPISYSPGNPERIYIRERTQTNFKAFAVVLLCLSCLCLYRYLNPPILPHVRMR